MKEPTSRRAAPAGRTLVELMVALPLTAALTAAALFATTTVSQSGLLGGGLLRDRLQSLQLASQIGDDLAFATSIPQALPAAVAVTVADRTGDGQDERIEYRWSGEPGTPLWYTFNDDPPLPIAEGLHALQLDYRAAPANSDDAQLLQQHDAGGGGTLASCDVSDTHWFAQYILPALPADATAWSVDEVRLTARRHGPVSGVARVLAAEADPLGRPAPRVLEEALLPESMLTHHWSEVTVEFRSLTGLDPQRGLCLVLAFASGEGKVGRFRYERDGDPMTPGTHWLESDDAGASWSLPDDRRDLQFSVVGKHDGTSAAGSSIASVRLRLQVGSDPQTLASGAFPLWNRPEAAP